MNKYEVGFFYKVLEVIKEYAVKAENDGLIPTADVLMEMIEIDINKPDAEDK